MGTLHQVNVGALEILTCQSCSSPREGGRAAAKTPSGLT
jgi:hypothetical protein